MNRILALTIALAACADNRVPPLTDSGEPAAASVRERLERGPATLAIAGAASSGGLTAQHRIAGGWKTGSVDLVIESGELALSLADGALAIDAANIGIAPIELPDSLFGYPVRLTEIHLDVTDTAAAVPTWISADEGRAALELDLELAWSLETRGEASPLGSPALPRVPVELVVTGDGDLIHAELRASRAGELWTWADLIKLGDLSLALDATN